MAKRREGFSNTEQWLVLGVPVLLLFGYMFLAGQSKAKAQASTEGLRFRRAQR